MSEEFETGLNELYTRAVAAHADGTGFPTPALVATARRNRRVRAAAVPMATVAAVVGVGFGGAAAMRMFGDGAPVAPVGSETPPVVGTRANPACGTSVADLRVFAEPPAWIDVALDATSVPPTGYLTGALEVVALDPGWGTEIRPSVWGGVEYAAVQGGQIVALPSFEGTDAEDVAFPLTPCADAGVDEAGNLEPGQYDLWAFNSATIDGDDAYLIGGPWPFVVTAGDLDPLTATPSPDPEALQPPEELGVDGASSAFTEGEPLADGDYFGRLQGIDAANGTIDVDLARFFGGKAAEDYIAANVPDAEPLDEYYIANDLETVTTLPVAADAPVWDWCFEPTEQSPLGYYLRTIDEWATAPVFAGQDVPAYQCTDGANLLRGDLYWLQVRDGVVVEVTGQYVP